MILERIRRVFATSLQSPAVFSRDTDGGQLFEADIVRKEGQQWLAIAAGVAHEVAHSWFPANSSRAERATIPV